MKIKCVNIGGKALLAPDIASGRTLNSNFHVTIGHVYNVYGLLFYEAVLTYLMVDDTGWPRWHPASLFEVTSPHVARSWVLVNWSSPEKYIVAVSFPEIVQSRESFDELTFGDRTAREKFFALKAIADLEFPDPSVEKVAAHLQGRWLQCPICSDAWESENLDAMVKCPTCGNILHNPSYREERSHGFAPAIESGSG